MRQTFIGWSYIRGRAASMYYGRSPPCLLQLRVIRAFKSTLEDLEERRSVHSLLSLHSLRSSRLHAGRHLSDNTFTDEDSMKSPSPLGQNSRNGQLELPRPVHETSI